jgi:hypothetical protein
MIFNITTGTETLSCSPLLKRARGKWHMHPKSERETGVVALELMRADPKYVVRA